MAITGVRVVVGLLVGVVVGVGLAGPAMADPSGAPGAQGHGSGLTLRADDVHFPGWTGRKGLLKAGLHVEVGNAGGTRQGGHIEVTLPDQVDLVDEHCTTGEGRTARCDFGELEPGQRRTWDLGVQGILGGYGRKVSGRVALTSAAGTRSVREVAFVFPPRTDLTIAATTASGRKGDVVTSTVTVTNKGQADISAFTIGVNAPVGTHIETPDCAPAAAPAPYLEGCELVVDGGLAVGAHATRTVRLRITGDQVTAGAVLVGPSFADVNFDNNRAELRVNVTESAAGGNAGASPELPTTGSRTITVAGVGTGLVAVGALLFVAARRRRVAFVRAGR